MPTKPTIWTPGLNTGHSLYTNLVRAWACWEGTSTTITDLANSVVGTFAAGGQAPVWGSGPVLDFARASSQFLSGNALKPAAGNWTLGVRVKLIHSHVFMGIFTETDAAGSYGRMLWWHGANDLKFGGIVFIDGGTYPECTTAVVSDENWHNLIFRSTAGTPNTIELFLDGSLTGSTSNTYTGISYTGVTQFLVGNYANMHYLDGSIDSIYEWSEALSADDIASLQADWWGVMRLGNPWYYNAQQ